MRPPPLPSPQVLIPIAFIHQTQMPGLLIGPDEPSFYELAQDISDGIAPILKSYGVFCGRGQVTIVGNRWIASFALEAGDWHEWYYQKGTMSRGVVRSICTGILRLIKANQERLG